MAMPTLSHICSHGQHATDDWELCPECHRYYCLDHAREHDYYHRLFASMAGYCEGIPHPHTAVLRFLCNSCGVKWCGLCEDHLIPTPEGGACPFSEAGLAVRS